MRDRNGFGVRSGCGDRGHSGERRRRASWSIIPPARRRPKQTADLCRSAGAEVVVVQGDVSRDEDCRKIVAAAAPWGRLDALINNAGTTKHVAHDNLDGLSAEDFQRLFGVNTIGPSRWCGRRASLLEAGAKASGRASTVVNVSSVAGISGDRLFGRLCREQGRAQHHDAFAGAGVGAIDPGQHGLSRLYRHALVHQGPRRRPPPRVRDSVIAKVPLKALQPRRMSRLWCVSSPRRIEQHDRRTRPDGRRRASDCVRAAPTFRSRHGRA